MGWMSMTVKRVGTIPLFVVHSLLAQFLMNWAFFMPLIQISFESSHRLDYRFLLLRI